MSGLGRRRALKRFGADDNTVSAAGMLRVDRASESPSRHFAQSGHGREERGDDSEGEHRDGTI
jgi:hypothetical protein